VSTIAFGVPNRKIEAAIGLAMHGIDLDEVTEHAGSMPRTCSSFHDGVRFAVIPPALTPPPRLLPVHDADRRPTCPSAIPVSSRQRRPGA
jgi:hypothetical protein